MTPRQSSTLADMQANFPHYKKFEIGNYEFHHCWAAARHVVGLSLDENTSLYIQNTDFWMHDDYAATFAFKSIKDLTLFIIHVGDGRFSPPHP